MESCAAERVLGRDIFVVLIHRDSTSGLEKEVLLKVVVSSVDVSCLGIDLNIVSN